MILSKEDMFCDGQQIAATGTTVSESVLDFHSQGDDLLFLLFLVVLVTGAMAGDGTLAIVFQSCAAEGFGSNVKEVTLASGLAAADLTKGTFAVKNASLPKGLLRYNRIAFKLTLAQGETVTTAPKFSAFIVDGRTEPLS